MNESKRLENKRNQAYELLTMARQNWHNLSNDEQDYFLQQADKAQKEYEDYTGNW